PAERGARVDRAIDRERLGQPVLGLRDLRDQQLGQHVFGRELERKAGINQRQALRVALIEHARQIEECLRNAVLHATDGGRRRLPRLDASEARLHQVGLVTVVAQEALVERLRLWSAAMALQEAARDVHGAPARVLIACEDLLVGLARAIDVAEIVVDERAVELLELLEAAQLVVLVERRKRCLLVVLAGLDPGGDQRRREAQEAIDWKLIGRTRGA